MSKILQQRMSAIRDELSAESGLNLLPDQLVDVCKSRFAEYSRAPGNVLKKAAMIALKASNASSDSATDPIIQEQPPITIDTVSDSLPVKRPREEICEKVEKKERKEKKIKPTAADSTIVKPKRKKTHIILNDDSDNENEVDGDSPDAGFKRSSSNVPRFEPSPLPSINLDNISGVDAVIPQIEDLIIRPLRHPEVPRHLGIMSMTHVLLHGPPGSGKTYLANAIAGSAGATYFKVNATEIVSGVSGESESLLRSLFSEAKKFAPTLVFIDEVDAITPRRDQAAREMERRIVAQLFACLDDLQGSNVVVIGATSRPDAIDPALRRAGRFDREIAVGIPDEKTRRAVLNKVLESVRVLRSDICPELNKKHQQSLLALKQKPDSSASSITTSATTTAADSSLAAQEHDVDMDAHLSPHLNFTIKQDNLSEVEKADAAIEAALMSRLSPSPLLDQGAPQIFHIYSDDKVNAVEVNTLARSTPGYVAADLGALVKEAALICVARSFKTLQSVQKGCAYSDDQLDSIAIHSCDFDVALTRVQPSARREGFATIPDVTWDDVGALGAIREELERLILQVQNPELCRRLSFRPSPGALLYGPPGCGKTLVAKAAARMSGANFISVKGPELLNKYVGESERGVRDVFQRARDSKPCVVFFDELDALCPRRGSEGSQATERVVNQLLTELDGVGGREGVLVLGATNRPDMIDEAMLRPGRLDSLLMVPICNENGRVDILKTLTRKSPLDADVDVVTLANRSHGFSGADLAAAVREATMIALEGAIKKHGLMSQVGETDETKQLRVLGDDEAEALARDVRITMDMMMRAMDKITPSVPDHVAEFYMNYKKTRDARRGGMTADNIGKN